MIAHVRRTADTANTAGGRRGGRWGRSNGGGPGRAGAPGAGEVGGPHEPCLVAELGGRDRGLGPVATAGELASEGLAGRVEEQVAGGADPAPDDERAGVERGGQVGHPDAEPAADLADQLARQRVALAGGLGDQGSGEVLGATRDLVEQVGRDGAAGRDERAGLTHEGVSGGVLLPAALVTALAPDAVGYDAHVPELARDAVATADDPPVEHDAPADAGAEVDHDQVALAAAGAEAVLGPHGGVGVVVDEDRQRHPLAERLPQRLVAPREVRREDDCRAVGRDEAGGPDADRGDVVGATGEQLLDDRDDRVLDHPWGGGPVRGVAPGAGQHVAVGVDDATGDLGATDVDADGERTVSHGIPPGGRRRRSPGWPGWVRWSRGEVAPWGDGVRHPARGRRRSRARRRWRHRWMPVGRSGGWRRGR